MNISNQEKIIVNHLVDVCKDSRDFYRTAADKVIDDDLEKLFKKNASIRKSIIVNLETYMEQIGDTVVPEGTLEGKTMEVFGELVASISLDADQAFVDRLEEAEDRSLEEFHNAMAGEISLELRGRIAGFITELQFTHDRMKAMKAVMKAA